MVTSSLSDLSSDDHFPLLGLQLYSLSEVLNFNEVHFFFITNVSVLFENLCPPPGHADTVSSGGLLA